jgi:hypothetical protein
MMRFLIWTAVSTEEQAQVEAPSLPAQRSALAAFAAQLANGQPYTVVDVLEIAGFSRYYTNWDLFRDAAIAAGHDAPRRMERHWHDRTFDVLLVLDISRIGRREGIVVDFVSRTIDTGATIQLKHGGEINASNYGAMMLMNAYSTAQEIRIKKQRQLIGNEGRFQRGLHAGTLPVTHVVIRDASGKPTGEYALDERYASIWRDVAGLLVEGVAWEMLEKELYQRCGHVNPRTGKPFGIMTLHNMIMLVPMFWGHLARVGVEAERNNPRRVSHWLYDESIPVPAHVQLKRNVFPAVWTGEIRQQVVQELIRRRGVVHGRSTATDTHMFSGLCTCGECGYTMRTIPIYKNSRKPADGYRLYLHCRSSTRRGNCTNTSYVAYDKVQAFCTTLIEKILSLDSVDDALPSVSIQTTADALRHEHQSLISRLDRLIIEQSDAPAIAQPRYRQQIEIVSQRMAIVQQQLDQQEVTEKQRERDMLQLQKTIKELRDINPAEFWQLPSRRINQRLKSLFGNRKIVLLNKNVLHLR